MSFAYLYSLVENYFVTYFKIIFFLTIIITTIYCTLFVFKFVEHAFFYGSLISLIFSFFILMIFGRKIFIYELKKSSVLILVITFLTVFVNVLIVYLEFRPSAIIFLLLIYFLFLVFNLYKYKFLLKNLRNTA